MKIFSAVVICLGFASISSAQMGRTGDWWSYAGDAQRSGFEKNDQKFTKEDVTNFKLLWKMKIDNKGTGLHSLMAPVIIGNLIGSRGFKELAFVASGSNHLAAIDSDLARMYWQKDLETPQAKHGRSSGSCSGGLTAMPTLAPPVTFRFPTPAAAPASAAAAAAPGASPASSTAPARDAMSAQTPGSAPRPAGANPGPAVGAGAPPTGTPATPPPSAAANPIPPAMRRVFEPKTIYLLLSSGTLRILNVDNGADFKPPVSFLPPNANAHSLNIADNVVYTVTSQNCGGVPNAVWALDLNAPASKAASFQTTGSDLAGLGGPALGTDDTVYVQTTEGAFNPASKQYGNAVLALTKKDLQLKDYFSLPDPNAKPGAPDMNVTTPVVFAYKGRDLVVTAAKDGRLYLLDSHSLGGDDHKTPLSRTEPISLGDGSAPANGLWGSLSSWEDLHGVRYVLATAWGPLHSGFKAPVANGDISHGGIVAFKVEEENGKPSLAPAWTSPDMASPAPPVIAQGVVFALSNGEFKRKVKRSGTTTEVVDHPKGATHATLYALDALTGKELYSTGDQVKSPGSLTGLSIANGRLYFTTIDNTLQVFGKYLETDH